MPNYLYSCYRCNCEFEVKKPMSDASRKELCPWCGLQAYRKYTPIPDSFGWRLTEASHLPGHKDEIERAV